jgi:predicted Ser/Thr protein kinase
VDDRLLAARLIERGLIAPQVLAQVQAQLAPGQPLAQALVARRLVAPAALAALAAAPSQAPGPTPLPPVTPGSARYPGRSGTARFPAGTPGTSRFPGKTPGSRSGSARHLPDVGEVIDGRYEITGRLGKGGMGVVLKGREVDTDRPVAIKMLLPGKTSTNHVTRFLREAQVAARLEHAGVIPVHTSGERNGCPYYVMEYVQGRDLHQIFADPEQLDLDDVVRLVEDVCRTMAICHDAGILHRDLKPHNVMVRDSDRRALVADFGLAREDSSERLTRTGQFLGTPGYIALEQLQDSKNSDHRADVYSLGAILFHGLAGEPPFQGSSLEQLFSFFSEEPPRPSERRAGIPKALDAICFKAMARYAEDRYQTAAELADDLARWRSGESVMASRASALFMFGRRLRRRERKAMLLVSSLGGVAVVALVSALVFALWVRPQQVARETVAAYREFDGQGCACPNEHRLEAYALGLGGGEAPSRDELAVWAARLESAAAKLDPATAEAALRDLARVQAHVRLLDHFDGADVEVPVREQAGRGTTDLLVDAIVLLGRDRPQRALARVSRAAERGELKGTVGLLRVALWEAVLASERADEAAQEFFVYLQQLESEGRADELVLARDQAARAIRNRYLAIVRQAPKVSRDETRGALERVLVTSADPALGLTGQPLVELLAGDKVAALEEAAEAWRGLLEAGAAASNEHGHLQPVRHLGAITRAEPVVAPGPKLRAALDEQIDQAVQAYDADDGDRKHELALRAVRLESTIFYEVDPSQVQGLDYGRLVRYVVSVDSYGNNVDTDAILAQLRTDPTRNIWETFLIPRFDIEDVKEKLDARPDSKALVYSLVLLVRRANTTGKKLDEELDLVELSDRFERVLAEGVPDLRFNYLANAYVTLARVLMDRLRGRLPDTTSPAELGARIHAALDAGRETSTEPVVLNALVCLRADAITELEGPGAAVEAWEDALREYVAAEAEGIKDPVASDWDHWRTDLLYARAQRLGRRSGADDELAVRVTREAVEAAHAHWEPEKSLEVRILLTNYHIRARRFAEAEAVLAPRLEDGWSNLQFAQLAVHSALMRQDGLELQARLERALAEHPDDAFLLRLQEQQRR